MSKITKTRYLEKPIISDLKEKMVFLGGPRQVGKTTFSKSLLATFGSEKTAYMNWDDPEHRDKILKKKWAIKDQLLVFDELHKYARWRNLIKGYYDTQNEDHKFLVTGSARLDYYRRGGDSLLGRYHYYRLHPFSLSEVGFNKGALEQLLKFGGFPEPFFAQNEKTLRRWQLQRLDRVVMEDLVGLEKVKEVSLVHRLAEALPDRVGSPLSVKNLANELEVDQKTASRWIEILENLYFCYRIPPYGAPRIKAVRKEQKLYLWDWSSILDPGIRFENLVASHLLKWCHFIEDTQGHRMELRFLRDINKREIDFVILKDKTPIFCVECKSGDKNLSSHIPYFAERTKISKFYQVHMGVTHRAPMKNVEIIPFVEFCQKMDLV